MYVIQRKIADTTLYARGLDPLVMTSDARRATHYYSATYAEQSAFACNLVRDWQVAELNVCEACGDNAGDDYYSLGDSAETGRGLCLCAECNEQPEEASRIMIDERRRPSDGNDSDD